MRDAASPGRVEISTIHVDNGLIPAAQRSSRRCCPVFRLPEVVVVAYPVHVLMPRLRLSSGAEFAAEFATEFAAHCAAGHLAACLVVVIIDRSRCLSLRPECLCAAGTFATRI
jgi:hypothetical protein